ncbi:MAG: hypothetical protein AAF529_23285 [Pseudomonadota bacterium]
MSIFEPGPYPVGEPGGLEWVGGPFRYSEPPADSFDDVLVQREPELPWFLQAWEPLPTNAPGPDKTRPYCCYIRTVIFYQRPYCPRAPGEGYIEHDRLEFRITSDTRLRFEGQIYKAGGGRVYWADDQWWMYHWLDRRGIDQPELVAV